MVRLVADAAAELARDGDGADDRTNGIDVDRIAGFGAVEIDQVDAGRAFRFPLRGHRRGVVAEDGLAIVITLAETDAQASPQIDGRDHLHGASPKRRTVLNSLTLAVATDRRKDRAG